MNTLRNMFLNLLIDWLMVLYEMFGYKRANEQSQYYQSSRMYGLQNDQRYVNLSNDTRKYF